MPLSFQSKSHGRIAFGFFNIESDMLLLENIFFFAEDFCRWMVRISREKQQEAGRFEYPVYMIEDPANVGDLMGAIHGVHHTGFIGDVYQVYPFPGNPSGFKQNPEGYKTREQMIALSEKWAVETTLVIECMKDGQVCIGPFTFLKKDFGELIRYVWQGGYPRWKEEVRPDYVMKMKQVVQNSSHLSFDEIFPREN